MLVDAEAGVEPVPVVRVGTTVLQADVDYEVRYQNNHTIGDNGAVIVVGKGKTDTEILMHGNCLQPLDRVCRHKFRRRCKQIGIGLMA